MQTSCRASTPSPSAPYCRAKGRALPCRPPWPSTPPSSPRRGAHPSTFPRLQLTPGTEPSRPREAPEPAHRRPKLPASCRRGTHGRRRPAPVELTPPASILKNRPAQQLPRPPTVLADPSAPLFPRRSAASAGTVRRRPPLTADRPPRAIFSRPETSYRCGSVPYLFSPTFPSPPGPNLAGNQAEIPPLFSNVRQGPRVRRNRSSRASAQKEIFFPFSFPKQ